jgi:hypothetical protein
MLSHHHWRRQGKVDCVLQNGILQVWHVRLSPQRNTKSVDLTFWFSAENIDCENTFLNVNLTFPFTPGLAFPNPAVVANVVGNAAACGRGII